MVAIQEVPEELPLVVEQPEKVKVPDEVSLENEVPGLEVKVLGGLPEEVTNI